MWWLGIPVIWAAKKLYDFATSDGEVAASAPSSKTTLELNLERLARELSAHKGKKIAIVGQPGAGKSSLLRSLTDGRAVPAPVIGVQTDATSWAKDQSCALLSFCDGVAYADVPGYDTTSHPVGTFTRAFPFSEFDCYILVVQGKLHSSDEEIYRRIAIECKRVCVARSYCESLDRDEIDKVRGDLKYRLNLPASTRVIFFSNRTKFGIEQIAYEMQR